MTTDVQIAPDCAVAPLASERVVTRLVVLIVYDGIQSLDVTGPLEVFSKAALIAPTAGAAPFQYRIVIASPRGGTVTSNSGLRIAGTVAVAALVDPIDTLMVAGGYVDAICATAEGDLLITWLRRAAPAVRRVASVCTGAFLLAAAALLEGKRATTHWASCTRLLEEYPAVKVESDAIFVGDDGVFTSAGVTAGIDLSLALVEQDLGSEVALSVARDLVLYLRRPGGQSQFSASLAAQACAGERFRDLFAWVNENLRGNLGIAALADRAAMSERNFGRLFKQQTGMTPSTYVERVRLDRAKLYLETTDWPLARVAERAGLGTVATLIRASRRQIGITPEQYRQRFQLTRRSLADVARRLA